MDLLHTIIGAGGGSDLLQHVARCGQLSPEQADHAMSNIIHSMNIRSAFLNATAVRWSSGSASTRARQPFMSPMSWG